MEKCSIWIWRICAEKTAALAFICDILDIEYFVLGSVSGLPDDYENQLREYAESEENLKVLHGLNIT